MSAKQEDLYISILRFGRDGLVKGIKYPELIAHLDKNNYQYEQVVVIDLFCDLFVSKTRPDGNHKGKMPEDDELYYLQNEGYFKLLEHEELSEARKSSRTATYFAIAAIFISIASSLSSIYFSVHQINSPTIIEHDQAERFSNLEANKTEIEQLTLQKQILKKLIDISKGEMFTPNVKTTPTSPQKWKK